MILISVALFIAGFALACWMAVTSTFLSFVWAALSYSSKVMVVAGPMAGFGLGWADVVDESGLAALVCEGRAPRAGAARGPPIGAARGPPDGAARGPPGAAGRLPIVVA